MFKNLQLRVNNQPPSQLSRALIITRRELRDSIRDWRIISPLISLTFIVPLLIMLGVRWGSGFLSKLEPGTFEDKVLPFATLAVGFFPMSFSLIIALESFVGEKERNCLEALLSAPLTDFELFAGKFIASVIPTLVASVMGTTVFVIGIMLTGGPLPAQPLTLLFFLLLGIAEALVMVTGAVIVSSHSTSVRAANLLASFIIAPMAIVIQIEAIIIIGGESGGLFFVLLALCIVFIILIRTGVRVFNREEILSREGGDSLKVKLILRNFGRLFARTPQETINNQKTNLRKFSVWRLYRHDIPQILVINKGATVLVLMALFIGVFVGWWLLTLEPVKELITSAGFSNSTRTVGEANPSCTDPNLLANHGITWQYLFFNNTRAVLVGSAFAFVTLGVAGMLFLMVATAPSGAIGNLFSQLGVNIFILFVGFLLPHGIFELPAAIFATAAATQVATFFVLPPNGMSIGRSLQFSIVNYIKLLALVIPLLLIAAIIEANFTPMFGCWLTNGKI
jgi:uncharacterized membrane protein SpoIIM required for sporulation/ABC-type transport system involved in multi-copper enzyme maturation permease subunit